MIGRVKDRAEYLWGFAQNTENTDSESIGYDLLSIFYCADKCFCEMEQLFFSTESHFEADN